MDLDLKRAIKAKPRAHQLEPLKRLVSPYGESLLDAADPSPLPEHPRPLMRRDRWRSLNGWWEEAVVVDPEARSSWRVADPPELMSGRILVPFSPETTLSGVGHELQPDELLWYRRAVAVPELAEGERLLLHFEAVDEACRVLVDGQEAGTHEGGYTPIDLDITDLLSGSATALIEVCVHDATEDEPHVRGKQRRDRGTIWYSAQSGIWQTVWLEVVPSAHIRALRLVPDADTSRLVARAELAGPRTEALLSLTVRDEGRVVATGSCMPGRSEKAAMTLSLEAVRRWSCDDPHLYEVEARYGDDVVRSYCAFRTCTVEPDDRGVMRFCLNHEPLLLKGVLDQGYWPESMMTAPSDEALEADIEAARRLGFNMIRKHAKVEAARWYYHADRLGMLVWQDMPFGGGPWSAFATSYRPTLFRRAQAAYSDVSESHWRALGSSDGAYRLEWERTMRATIERLAGHPSIVTWVLFNEGWGQFSSADMTEVARELDPTRPIDAASGWYDQGAGDYVSVHNYYRTLAVYPDDRGARLGARRAFVLSEFGGLTRYLPEHSSCPEAYGYAEFDTPEAWQEAVRGLIAQAAALWDEGLAGFVYAQLADIEEEANGLLTYDRRVDKMDGRPCC